MRLSVGQKIFSIAAVMLTLMAAAAIASMRMIEQVSDELEIVAHRQLPASGAISQIAVHVLEQGVAIQRLVAESEDPEARRPALERAQRALDLSGARIESRFEVARRLLTAAAADPHAAHRTEGRLLPRLERVRAAFVRLDALADAVLGAHAAGDRAYVRARIAELDALQDALNAEIVAFRSDVEALGHESTAAANRSQRVALAVHAALTALAAVLGVVFAALVTAGLVGAVRRLLRGTQAVEAGALDATVEVRTHDELGALGRAFNHMVRELRLKERIRNTFGKYMDPRIVSRLLDAPEVSEPGGERRAMTVMFIDLKGFTSLAERLAPDALVRSLNLFLTQASRAVAAHRGVVDKFIGDAVMAYWGPPFVGEGEHATLACRAAAEVLHALERLRAEIALGLGAAASAVEIDLRIGISTGEMIVGTVGSEVARSYTVIGDPVNLGARLEAANKEYGTRVLVSGTTRDAVSDPAMRFREIDLLRVVGKREPARVFELCVDGAADAPRGESHAHFARGLAAYRRRDWDAAEAALRAAQDADSGDRVASVFLARVALLRASPPPEDWDGVWAMTSK